MTVTTGVRARLYVDQALDAGRSVDLSANQSHYLNHVLRLGPGAEVALFNGKDGEWRARIETIRRNAGSLGVETQTRPQVTEPDLWLLFAPIKRARLDMLVQKAVELGVSRLVPVLTERTEVKRLNADRHRSNLIEAAEQCERMTLPEIVEPRVISEVLSDFPTDRRLLVCAERGHAEPINEMLEDDTGEADRCAILCGPEGGFAETELDALQKLSFIRFVSLGPRILRAETAAISAVTCWQAALGDWRRRPPDRDLT